eukprot:TRINITY_DN14039_c0_g1_i1.p1 TRINITY_DN14039_c0_g1~~TRINITY_DN14039_c0_g1_i1.p1  ORF type:complete len:329 (+),score=70.56 TRINITY_DN14039_c0_g1_i1:183-1169(+)
MRPASQGKAIPEWLPPDLASLHTKVQASLRRASSAPGLPEIKNLDKIYSKRWTTETKRFLHQRRERRWLELKHKHQHLDFSSEEQAALRHYFDALAGSNGRVCMRQLENLLISLGLADDPRDVALLVEKIDDLHTGELDFNQFSELVRTRSDSTTLKVFKDMMDGKLGDWSLNFQTVLSEYRRTRILEAAGSHPASNERKEFGSRVLQNFAALQRQRFQETHGVDTEAMLLSPTSSFAEPLGSQEPSFTVTGRAPMIGVMPMVWRGVVAENNFLSEEAKKEARKAIVEKPMSPREMFASITRGHKPHKLRGTRGTIIIPAEREESLEC